MPGEAMLRVGNVRDEAAMESVRDALDRLGVDYEHVRSEPDDDRFPRAHTSTSPTTRPRM
jgi:hypothetical protein